MVANILRNVQYTGVLRSGESRSDVIPALQIVSQEQFERVGKGLEQRCVNYAKKLDVASQEEAELSDSTAFAHPPRTVPVRNCGQSLLSSNIYCGHCGARMFSSTAKRTGHVGKEEKIRVYRFYSRANHMQECDGQSTYQAAKVEARSAEIRAHHRKLVSWADVYKDASLEEKRAVAAFLIKSVILTRGYEMRMEFNISETQYLSGLDIA